MPQQRQPDKCPWRGDRSQVFAVTPSEHGAEALADMDGALALAALWPQPRCNVKFYHKPFDIFGLCLPKTCLLKAPVPQNVAAMGMSL
jgi:hypothetical protein